MPQTRERIDYDVVVVGGGPAGLATAIHLKRKLKAAGQEATVALLEKGAEIGALGFSGCVMDPRGLDALLPGWRDGEQPAGCTPVGVDEVRYFTSGGQMKIWPTPPPFVNHGNFVVSVASLCRWLGKRAEAEGVEIFPGFSAVDVVFKRNADGTEQADAVRIGDKGVSHSGSRRGNFEPGIDIGAKLIVLAEGVRGSLTKQMIARFGLMDGKNPQQFATGVKEMWELPKGRLPDGYVLHTMGFPLDSKTFGGGFIYKMAGDLLHFGLVVGLDYADPLLDPHFELQRMKTHPFFRKMLEGGKMVEYGAKAITESGYWSMPKPVLPGLMIVGESAGFLNSERLKGVHLAIESGMMAAETAVEALAAGDFGEQKLLGYSRRIEASAARKEMWKSRNVHQGFADGFWPGLVTNGLRFLLGGKIFADRLDGHHDHAATSPLAARPAQRALGAGGGAAAPPGKSGGPRNWFKPDGVLTFDKLTSVYHSNTKHEEDQPSHLVIADFDVCNTRCKEEYGNPCQYFCPAGVYEMVEKENAPGIQLKVNFSNCVHCKTCDVKDPYQIINWVPPEGGGGPRYSNT